MPDLWPPRTSYLGTASQGTSPANRGQRRGKSTCALAGRAGGIMRLCDHIGALVLWSLVETPPCRSCAHTLPVAPSESRTSAGPG